MGATWVFGPQIYHTRLFGYPMARYFEFATYISGVLTSHPVIIKNIYLSYKNKTGKMRPFCDAIRPLIPLFGLYIISSVWVFLSQNDIVRLEPRVLFMCFGTVFSNFTVSCLIRVGVQGFKMISTCLFLVSINCGSNVRDEGRCLELTVDPSGTGHLRLCVSVQIPRLPLLH